MRISQEHSKSIIKSKSNTYFKDESVQLANQSQTLTTFLSNNSQKMIPSSFPVDLLLKEKRIIKPKAYQLKKSSQQTALNNTLLNFQLSQEGSEGSQRDPRDQYMITALKQQL